MNPWHKRANEFIRDASELLPLISPEPIKHFFRRETTSLFDRLVVVVGSPGCGKTTLSRLLELRTLAAAPDFRGNTDVRELLASLANAGVLNALEPAILAMRLPAGGQLRSIWDLPYEPRLRHRLLRSMIQAKTVLGWLRAMEDVGISLEHVRIVTTPNAEAAREAVSAENLKAFRERARITERAIFKLINALVAPAEESLSEHLVDVAYAPFEIIESIEVDSGWRSEKLCLRPMLVIDDAHELHPAQLEDVDIWLRDREIKIARWMLTRIDSLNLEDFRRILRDDETVSPGTNPGRDRVRILLQDTQNRNRHAFRAIADDLARRYLQPLAAFHRRGGIQSLKSLLNSVSPPALSDTDLQSLTLENARLVEKNQLNLQKVETIESAYPPDLNPDVRAAVTRIMLERELKRTPQQSLFGAPTEDPSDEDVPKVQRAVVTGAELHLLHRFDRPFFFGFERLADAANENIEQFVTLASVLVDRLETQAIRGKPLRIDARQQHRALREHALHLIDQWDFPYAPQVRNLVDFIGGRCLEISLRPNAPLSDGANAFGILQSELANLGSDDELARVLHYALAYQALVLVEPYDCKKKTWALFELGGVAIIAKGLTHNRGGFVEGTLHQLKSAVESTQ